MDKFQSMRVLSLEDVDTFYEPEDLCEIGPGSPAMEVVTDFHYKRPLILEADVSIDEAERLMSAAHVHMKLVVDSGEHFLGIATMSSIKGTKVLQIARERDLKREDITVADVMEPRSKLHALSYSELQNRTVGDVLQVLSELGKQHILVLDEDQKRICGVVAASDIARVLRAPVEIVRRAITFVDVINALSH